MSTDVDQDTLDPERFDPLDPATMQCPFPHHANLRSEAPVQYVESIGAYFVTRHDLVSEVLRDSDTYSSRRGRSLVELSPDDLAALAAVQKEGLPRMPTLLTADAPRHTRYRRLVSKPFSPRVIAGHEDLVRSITTRLIDSWAAKSRIEFVEAFAVPLPIEVIAKLLNVPDNRLGDFKRWSDDTVVGFGNKPTVEELLRAERGVNELQSYFVEALEDRRVNPRDDLLTDFVEARIDDDDADVEDNRPLDNAETVSIIQQLLVGGNETTTKLLAQTMLFLAENPEQWHRIQQDPSTIPDTVEESLRLTAPVQGMWRITNTEVELGGVTIPAGGRLVIAFGSANRDEAVYESPGRFDPTRENLEHLAFGRGRHLCLGASLGRLEVRVALEEFAVRFKSFSLADTNNYAYNESFLLRGLLKLDLDIELNESTRVARAPA